MKQTLNDRLAAYFRSRAGEWVNAHDLLPVAGFAAWRTRLSELRKPPYAMPIENRVEIVNGRKQSWYRFVPAKEHAA